MQGKLLFLIQDFIVKGNDGGATITAMTLDMSAAGAATFNSSVTENSDERLKTDIRTIDNALNLVNDMRGVYFTKDGEARTGVVAQEIEKVLPEAVYTTETVTDEREGEESEEHLAIRYGNTVGLLVEAIKELEARVKELEGK